MKNKKNHLVPLFLSFIFLLWGLIFNPVVLPLLFSSITGKNMDALSILLALFADFIAFGLSFFFYKIRHQPLSLYIRLKWKELTAFTISMLICLSFAELILRFWTHHCASDNTKSGITLYSELKSTQKRFKPSLYLNYSLNPEYMINAQNEHNSLGFRGKEIQTPKPPGHYRIVCMGGSTTYTGKVKQWQNAYPALMEKQLIETYGYNKLDVINAGVPGYSSWETLINFSFRVLDISPDMIIIYHAVNDATARIVEPSSYRSDNTGWRRSWDIHEIPFWKNSYILRFLNNRYHFFSFPSATIDNAIQAETTLCQADIRTKNAILKQNLPVFFERNLSNIIAMAKENDIQVVLATFAYTTEFEYIDSSFSYIIKGIEEHNDIIRDLARKYNLPIIDFRAMMPQDIQYWADMVHVNESGSLLKAKVFAEFLDNEKLIDIKAENN